MGILIPDSRRRITLPEGYVEPGQKFVAIKTAKGVLLQPVPKVTLEDIQKEGEKLKGRSIEALRKHARKSLGEDALNGLRRH